MPPPNGIPKPVLNAIQGAEKIYFLLKWHLEQARLPASCRSGTTTIRHRKLYSTRSPWCFSSVVHESCINLPSLNVAMQIFGVKLSFVEERTEFKILMLHVATHAKWKDTKRETVNGMEKKKKKILSVIDCGMCQGSLNIYEKATVNYICMRFICTRKEHLCVYIVKSKLMWLLWTERL